MAGVQAILRLVLEADWPGSAPTVALVARIGHNVALSPIVAQTQVRAGVQCRFRVHSVLLGEVDPIVAGSIQPSSDISNKQACISSCQRCRYQCR